MSPNHMNSKRWPAPLRTARASPAGPPPKIDASSPDEEKYLDYDPKGPSKMFEKPSDWSQLHTLTNKTREPTRP